MDQIISKSQGASTKVEAVDGRVVLTITGDDTEDFAQVSMDVGPALDLVRAIQSAAADASLQQILQRMVNEANGE